MTVIRQATLQDTTRILVLYEELTGEKQSLTKETLQRVFSQIEALPNHHFLVAENDGLVTGTLFLLIVPNLSHEARPWAVVENIMVDRRMHRQGIGRQLMEYAFERCREAKCYKIQLLSNQKRMEAHQFYRSLGFDESVRGFRKYFL